MLKRRLIILYCIAAVLCTCATLPLEAVLAEPSLSLDPEAGPPGSDITLSGSGFAVSSLTFVWFDSNGDGIMTPGEPQRPTVTTSTGDLPTGLTLTAPGVEPDEYQVLVDVFPLESVDAAANFTVTGVAASISLEPDSGPVSTEITITGSNFDPNTAGYIWFDTNDNSVIDDETFVSVSSTAEGEIPPGTILTVPAVPGGVYLVRTDIPDGDDIEASANFTKSSTTIWVTVTKYDAYGDVIAISENVTWQEMMTTMPVCGDGVTHYYCHGPTFNSSNTLEAKWDSAEMVNIDSRDYGAAMGTDVKDLCDLVGGASPDDVIEIVSPDGFNKSFDYEDVYNPEPEQGKMVITWYTADTIEGSGGYVPEYDTGMRLLFFAETLNPEGKNVFGTWDMHETLAASRWHFY